jgi:hypothetical protein
VSLPRASVVALASALLLITACASWRGQDAAKLESQARSDDAKCVAGGVSFPSEAYDHCRRHLADVRADKQRREVALGTQQSTYAALEAPPQPEGIQRSIDPERFHCTARGEGATRVIYCEEK